MQILYIDPTKRTNKEGRSKLLDPDSDLYKLIKNIQSNLENNGIHRAPDRIDLQVELLDRRGTVEATTIR